MSKRLELLNERLYTASKLLSHDQTSEHIDLLIKALDEILKRLEIELFVAKTPTPHTKAMLAIIDVRKALDNYLANMLGEEYEAAEVSAKQVKKMADQLVGFAKPRN